MKREKIPEKSRWTTDIENWDKLSPDAAKLYLELAHSSLKASEDTATIANASNDKLIGYATTILSISLAYLFTGNQLFLQVASLSAIFIVSGALYFLIRNILNYTLYTVGEEPHRIFTKEFTDKYEDPNIQFLNLILSTMENAQAKISLNKELNLKRAKRLQIAKFILASTPFAFILAAFYLYYLGYRLVWVF